MLCHMRLSVGPLVARGPDIWHLWPTVSAEICFHGSPGHNGIIIKLLALIYLSLKEKNMKIRPDCSSVCLQTWWCFELNVNRRRRGLTNVCRLQTFVLWSTDSEGGEDKHSSLIWTFYWSDTYFELERFLDSDSWYFTSPLGINVHTHAFPFPTPKNCRLCLSSASDLSFLDCSPSFDHWVIIYCFLFLYLEHQKLFLRSTWRDSSSVFLSMIGSSFMLILLVDFTVDTWTFCFLFLLNRRRFSLFRLLYQ